MRAAIVAGVLVLGTVLSARDFGLQQRDTTMKPAAGSAIISGVVATDEQVPTRLRRAQVTLAGAEVRVVRVVVTDDLGRFVFADLPGGRYELTAEKPAFVRTFYGSKRPGRGPGTPVAVADGERVTDLTIRMLRGAVIAGTVRDELGVPIASGQVRSLQPLIVNSERRLVDPPGGVRVTTDDRGRYRIYGLAPGEYTVWATGNISLTGDVRETTEADLAAAAREVLSSRPASATVQVPSSAKQVGRSPVYFPGVANPAGAEMFTLRAGEERLGVDVTVPLVRSSRVEGICIGPDGQPLQNVMMSLVNLRDRTTYTSPGFYRPGADGRFLVPSLPSGEWALVARAGESGAPANSPLPLWAETDFVVTGDDLSGVVLQFAPGSTVAGRLVFHGGSTARPSGLRISLTSVGAIPGSTSAPPPVVLQPDSTFAFPGVAPGRYRVAVTGIGVWTLRAAMLNDRDTLDAPFEVRARQDLADLNVLFTDQPTEISGTVVDSSGRPTPEYAVVMFPTDRSLWATAPRRLTGAVKLGSDGAYRVAGLPPGEYYLSAITDVEPAQLNDPSFLEQLAASAMTVTLKDGEKKVQNLKLAS